MLTNVKNVFPLITEDELINNIISKYDILYSSSIPIKFKNTEKQRAVYKIISGDKNYCLKKIYFSKADLYFVYSAIEWLFRWNFNVPRIIPTKDKNKYVEYKNMLFILMPWIEGEKFDYDLNDISYASLTLGKIHKFTTNFYPIQGSSYRFRDESIKSSVDKRIKYLIDTCNLAFKKMDEFSKLFLKHFDNYYSCAKIAKILSESMNLNNLKISLCHSDYVSKNLILDENNELWVIDFDKCTIGYSIHDLSYFLKRILRRTNTNWDEEVTIKSILSYSINNELNMDELKYLAIYLCFPNKYLTISREYFTKQNPDKKLYIQEIFRCIEKDKKQIDLINFLLDYMDNFSSIH